METPKLYTRAEASKQHGTRPLRRPKSLEIFEHDLDQKAYRHLSNQQFLSIDTETTGLDPLTDTLLLIQICTTKDKVYFIRRPDVNSKRLKKLFAQPKVWIFHWMFFDLQFLMTGLGQKIAGIIECTKTMMKIVHPELKSGLGSALREILDLTVDKKIKHEWGNFNLTKRQIEYAANDVLYLNELRQALYSDILTGRCEDLNIYNKAVDTLRAMAEFNVSGYGDLLRYEQEDYAKTHKQRLLWSNGMKREGD